MKSLQNNLQVILQTQTPSAVFLCEGFTGIPILNPCFIVVAAPSSVDAQREAEKLRRELIPAILNLGANAQLSNVPCSGLMRDFWGCHAHRVTVCQKLLVLVGDTKTRISSEPGLTQWADLVSKDLTYRILPIFPDGASVSMLLPPALQVYNTIFWSNSIAETIPHILAASGLTSQEFRIFICYRRAETQSLADQLFDALSRENFDVFMDRFRNPPGVNFPLRLLQELVDKSMILVLESPNILMSQWTRLEIAFAKLYRLGLMALNLPGALRVPDIDQDERECISGADFATPSYELTQKALQRVVERIKVEHGIALTRRRQFLRDTMRFALLLAGVYRHNLGADGLLRVQSVKDYSVWLTPRPPEVTDFHVTDINRKPAEDGILIAPAMYEPTRKATIDWLAGVSKIKHYDEGQIWQAAQDISKGI